MAQTKETSFESYYNLKTEDLFKEAEPYHYGSGSPLKNWYLPLGEDNNALTTEDIKIQAPETNGYSEIGYIEEYRIEGNKIPYIKKGTFPLAGEDHLIIQEEEISGKGETSGYTYKNTYPNCTIRVYFTTNTLTNIPTNKLEIFNSKWESPNTSEIYQSFFNSMSTVTTSEPIPFEKWGLTEAKRLGFILVGAGGGGGGASWYFNQQTKKDKTQVKFAYPGSGGGGGGILIGALLIDPVKIKTAFNIINASSSIEHIDFIFSIGKRGYRGNNYQSTNKMDYGQPGAAGGNTSLVAIELKYGEYNADIDKTIYYYKCKTFTDIKALGGAGGAAGNHSQPVKGGLGGGYQFPKSNNINKNCVYVAKGVKGGNGSGADKESEHNDAPAFKCDLYLSNTDASNTDCCFKIDHPTRASVTDLSENTDPSKFSLNNTTVAGGSSYGNGAYRDSSGPHVADIGGGGSSGGDGFTDTDDSYDLRYGGGGGIILFY